MMSELRITQEDMSSWTVSGPGLILTGLRREAASAFVEAYIRCRKAAKSGGFEVCRLHCEVDRHAGGVQAKQCSERRKLRTGRHHHADVAGCKLVQDAVAAGEPALDR